MHDFSIESEASRIVNAKSRQYFKEVLSPYIGENYRSSIVMLWTVIVCDLVFKLQHLIEVDSDDIASDILELVKQRQNGNPRSSDWELFLVEQVQERSSLIDIGELESLKHIQKLRHLCAHPVLSETDILYSPNKDEVRSAIRVGLTATLLKHPLSTKNIVDVLVKDLAEKSDIFPEDQHLAKYLKAKYFDRFSDEIGNRVFRTLWKFVFRLENNLADANRQINFRALNQLYLGRRSEFNSLIKTEAEYFSEVSLASGLEFLLLFLSEYPGVFEMLTDTAKEPIRSKVNESLDKFAIAFYLSENIEAHGAVLLKRITDLVRIDHGKSISKQNWDKLKTVLAQNDLEKVTRQLAVEFYIRSQNYRSADIFYDNYIRPFLGDFEEAQMLLIIREGYKNSQVTGHSRSTIRELLVGNGSVISDDFDWDDYEDWSELRNE